MRFDLISLFPEIFDALHYGITGRAIKAQQMALHCWNPRDFTADPYQTVDDRPYGGGPGMLMKVAPLRAAIQAAKQQAPESQVIYLSPQGIPFKQHHANQFSQATGLILVAGRYEGIDQRIIETDIDQQYSIGDYVLSGGEIPAMVMIDSITRLLPNVLGNQNSAQEDSFMTGLLDCPHYTRPKIVEGISVPEVLLNGHHQHIKHWRLQQALLQTAQRRPDLLKDRTLNEEEQKILNRHNVEF